MPRIIYYPILLIIVSIAIVYITICPICNSKAVFIGKDCLDKELFVEYDELEKLEEPPYSAAAYQVAYKGICKDPGSYEQKYVRMKETMINQYLASHKSVKKPPKKYLLKIFPLPLIQMLILIFILLCLYTLFLIWSYRSEKKWLLNHSIGDEKRQKARNHLFLMNLLYFPIFLFSHIIIFNFLLPIIGINSYLIPISTLLIGGYAFNLLKYIEYSEKAR